MMNKRKKLLTLITSFTVLAVIIASTVLVRAVVLDTAATKFLNNVNAEIKDTFGYPNYYGLTSKGREIRKDLLTPGHHIVYGSNNDLNNGVYRNWGYTRDGDAYPNEKYPPDAWSMKVPMEQWKWVDAPWDKVDSKNPEYIKELANQSTIKNLLASQRFDYTKNCYTTNNGVVSVSPINDKYQENIIAGLKSKYLYNPDGTRVKLQNGLNALDGSYDDKTTSGAYKIPWYKYVHVLQPPTAESWGLGIMVHKGSSQYWYVTVPIAPTNMLLDLATTITNTGVPSGQKAIPGQTYMATVEYSVKGSSRTAQCTFKAGSTSLLNGGVSLSGSPDADGTISVTKKIQWKCPEATSIKLTSTIEKVTGETDTTNNTATKTVNIDFKMNTSLDADGCFLDVPKQNGSNMETTVIRGLHYTITDPVKVAIKILLFENLPENTEFKVRELISSGKGKVIFNDYAEFTAAKPYWIKKITYDVPDKGYKSGIVVQTGPDITDKAGVFNYTWHTSIGPMSYGTHTTAIESCMDFLPWALIEKNEKIDRPNESDQPEGE